MDTDVQFRHWLQRQLVRREWSAADFARRLGVGNSTVTMWLREERVPKPASCRKIADALNLPRREVLIAAGHDDPDPDIDLDSPAERLYAKMKRVKWDPVRAQIIDDILDGMERRGPMDNSA